MQTIQQPQGAFKMSQADDVFFLERFARASLRLIRVFHHTAKSLNSSFEAQYKILLIARTACRRELTKCYTIPPPSQNVTSPDSPPSRTRKRAVQQRNL